MEDLVKKVLEDAHHSRRWPSWSQDACCATRLRPSHRSPAGHYLHWRFRKGKCENISIDYVDGLPRSKKRNTGMRVIIGRLTKSAHFSPVKSERTASWSATVYPQEVGQF